DNKPLPSKEIVKNVLEDLGVPRASTDKCYDVIIDTGKKVGFICESSGKLYVDLAGSKPSLTVSDVTGFENGQIPDSSENAANFLNAINSGGGLTPVQELPV